MPDDDSQDRHPAFCFHVSVIPSDLSAIALAKAEVEESLAFEMAGAAGRFSSKKLRVVFFLPPRRAGRSTFEYHRDQ
jgi:hypothetical protein